MRMRLPPTDKIAGVPISRLEEMTVSDLADEHRSLLGKLVSNAGGIDELSDSTCLKFLAELWLSEKMKGREADREAISKIEAIVLSVHSAIAERTTRQKGQTLQYKFSKKHAQLLRDETASLMKGARNKHNADWKVWTEKKIMESGNQEMIKAYHKLKNSLWGRLVKSEKYLAQQALFAFAVKTEREHAISEIRKDFDAKLREMLGKIPLTKEEQDTLLSEGSLKRMNVEDYLCLMNRLSGTYFAHATRFGVREQTMTDTGGGHVVGKGTFMDNFTPILESKSLGSLYTSIISQSEYGKGVITRALPKAIWFLSRGKGGGPAKAEVVSLITDEIMSAGYHPSGMDGAAPHFSVNEMLSNYYGAERGYPIYFYFPAEAVAKNFYHSSMGSKVHWELGNGREGKHNDFIIFNYDKGIPIDVGIVVIPEKVMVDQRTGSQYLLDKNNNPVERKQALAHIRIWEKNFEEFKSALVELSKAHSSDENDIAKTAEKLGFKDISLFKDFWETYRYGGGLGSMRAFYFDRGLLFEKPPAESLVTSRQYWEAHFEKHPEQRPSKLIYGSLGVREYGYHWKMGETELFKAYSGLMDEKAFTNRRDVPGYDDFYQKMRGEINRIVGKTYDEIYGA